MDFDALVLGALDPPIAPCRSLSRPAHRANFDGRFTTLPVDTPVEGPDPLLFRWRRRAKRRAVSVRP